MNARPKRLDIAHDVYLAQPHLGIGVDPTTVLNEVYGCVSRAFEITPDDVTVTKTEKIGQAKLTVTVLKGNGILEFTATGYKTYFKNLIDNQQSDFVLERIDKFNQNIAKIMPFKHRRNSNLQLGTWYAIDGGNLEIDRLLKRLIPPDNRLNSQQMGATEVWIPSYHIGYSNSNEHWTVIVKFERSAFDWDELYYSVFGHFSHEDPDWTVSKMAEHTLAIRKRILQLVGIEVENA